MKQRMGLWTTLGLIVALMIGIMIISRPVVLKMDNENKTRVCIENLALLEVAKAKYAIDNELVNGAPCTMEDLIAHGGAFQEVPACPKGGTYVVGALGVTPTCSLGKTHAFQDKRGQAVDAEEDLIK